MNSEDIPSELSLPPRTGIFIRNETSKEWENDKLRNINIPLNKIRDIPKQIESGMGGGGGHEKISGGSPYFLKLENFLIFFFL